MNTNKEEFIAQTAFDYDMPLSEVTYIYDMWNSKGLFYQKLEEYLKSR